MMQLIMLDNFQRWQVVLRFLFEAFTAPILDFRFLAPVDLPML
jgi:hypothetical protein